jgi:hypothetical protein
MNDPANNSGRSLDQQFGTLSSAMAGTGEVAENPEYALRPPEITESI